MIIPPVSYTHLILFNGVGALQLLHKGVQLLCGVVALVDLVPQFAGKVGGVVDLSLIHISP